MANPQLQQYLENLYRRNVLNTYPYYSPGSLITPGYGQAQDYLLQEATRRATEAANYRPPRTKGIPGGRSTTPARRPGTSDALNTLRTALESNWRAQGNAPYTSPTLPNSTTNMRLLGGVPVGTTGHVPPGGYPHTPIKSRPDQIGTPNPTILRLEAARAALEKLPHGQSLGKTSLDLDPNLQVPADPLAGLEAEIRALANQPDIPGQWISPYSQEYLNQLGGRLGQAGSEAQAQFQAAIGDIVENYGAGMTNVSNANAALVNELTANAGNIGVGYGASQQGQQMASDVGYLNQTARINQATDTSFMSKLGELANFYGGNLAAQAREGLLTPKQWVGPQSGISGGESLLADFLQSKYNRELDRQDAARKFEEDMALEALKGGTGIDPATGRKIGESADEKWLSAFPEVTAGFEQIKDPALLDMLQEVWGLSGTDPTAAGKLAEERLTELEAGAPKNPMLSQIPSGVMTTGYKTNVANYMRQKSEYDRQKALIDAVIEYYRRYSPGWGNALTARTLGNTSDYKYELPYG